MRRYLPRAYLSGSQAVHSVQLHVYSEGCRLQSRKCVAIGGDEQHVLSAVLCLGRRQYNM